MDCSSISYFDTLVGLQFAIRSVDQIYEAIKTHDHELHYNHIQWNPRVMRLHRVTSEWLGYRPFWLDIAAAKRRVCGVIDVPMTFLVLNEDVLEVVSWASHDQLVPFAYNRPDVDAS